MAYKHWYWLGPEEPITPLLTLFSLIPAVPSSPMKRWSQQIRLLLRLELPDLFFPSLVPSSCFLFKIVGSQEEIVSS